VVGDRISKFLQDHWIAVLSTFAVGVVGGVVSIWSIFTHKTVPEKITEWLLWAGITMSAFRLFLGFGLIVVVCLLIWLINLVWKYRLVRAEPERPVRSIVEEAKKKRIRTEAGDFLRKLYDDTA